MVASAGKHGVLWDALRLFVVDKLRAGTKLPISLGEFAALQLEENTKRPRAGLGSKYGF